MAEATVPPDAAALLVAAAMMKHVAPARQLPAIALTRREDGGQPTSVLFVCLTYLDITSIAHVRYMARRARRRFPHASILACFTTDGAVLDPRALEVDHIAGSIADAVETCVGLARRDTSALLSVSPEIQPGASKVPKAQEA